MIAYPRLTYVCRFAQFFVAPLFTAGATDREMNAVDSGMCLITFGLPTTRSYRLVESCTLHDHVPVET